MNRTNHYTPAALVRDEPEQRTRYCGLNYQRQGRDWRFRVIGPGGEGTNVGPIYPTKAALLADMERYAREYGF